MPHESPVEQLLRWRFALAEADAPSPPHAAELLALVRPWWERWPERFRAQAERLRPMPLAYGYAMAASPSPLGHAGYPVPVLLAQATDTETYARVLYLVVRDGRLRLRFALDGAPGTPGAPETMFAAAFDAAFVGEASEQPLCAARAERAQSGEYRVDVELPPDVAGSWAPLKVTDRMPFRLILSPVADAA
jgi:hypothetical protein